MTTKIAAVKNDLHINLFDTNEEVVLETIEKLRISGDETCIEPLLNVLLTDTAISVELKIISLLSDVKDPKGVKQLLSTLGAEKYKPIASKLLDISWNNNNMNLAPYLKPIVKWSIDTDLYGAIEGLTAVESIEDEVAEEVILECMVMCTKFLNDNPADERHSFVEGILNRLQELEQDNVAF